jgi:DNA repair exonuclease SbcCD ATPase subunit
MKKLFVLSMLISLVMICSCQKQDSTTEAQLAQRKTELDAREKALDERENAVAEREKAVAAREKALTAREKAAASVQSPTNAQSRGAIPDAAQLNPERDKRIQQLPPEVRALIPAPPDPARMKAERDRMMQEQLSQRQRRLEELQKSQSGIQNPSAMSDALRMQMNAAKQAAIPATTSAPGAVYPGAEATSPSPSPTPTPQ